MRAGGRIWYGVGPDVALAADGFVGRNHHDDYIRTQEYRAFTAGALHFMKVDHVDLLVLGLPVSQYMNRRAELQKAMTGTFDVGRKRKVEVRRASWSSRNRKVRCTRCLVTRQMPTCARGGRSSSTPGRAPSIGS